jgi:protein tyrosine phosphatase (PTP) superfamily phosphohydrolase (DUF442 family)
MPSQTLNGILNYLSISDTIGTAGQPNPEQFADISAAGYEVVVNLAMSDSTNALPNERELATEQGMEYVHIPVVFEAPTGENLEQFFEVMERNQNRKIFVHCVVNYRVSAFTFLYRVIRQGAPLQAARETMRQIWEPDAVWQRLIDETLARYQPGVAP